MRGIQLIAGALALAMLPGRSGAQAPAAPEPDPLYRVEIIVFAYNDGNRGEEDFSHGRESSQNGYVPPLLHLPRLELESLDLSEPPQPASSTNLAIGAADNASAIPAAGPDKLELIEPVGDRPRSQRPFAIHDDEPMPDGFRILRADELELGDAARTLDRLGAYRVLGHIGWEQTGVDIDRAVPLDLKRLGITNPRGTIELYLRRFLHIVVDLDYSDGRGALWSAPQGVALAPFDHVESYRLATELNAIRRGELHFIDHPLFGALVRITAAPEDESDAAEAGSPAA
jgi:hypothetical protein